MTRLRLIKNIVLLILISTTYLYPQTINNIDITGGSEFSSNDYLDWCGVKSGDNYTVEVNDSIRAGILLELTNNGYMHGSVSINTIPKDSSSLDLFITVAENEPTYVDTIFFADADSLYYQYLHNQFKFLEGNIFNKYELESVFADMMDYFENEGNPFAAIKVNSVYFFQDEEDSTYLANIYLTFNLEDTRRVDKIMVTGNTKTKDYVVKRNTRILEGEEYSQDKVDQVPRLLNHLRFFEPVNPPVYYFNSRDEGILNITVEEKATNSFDGIVGYVPSATEGQSGFFTGFVNINLRNLFGTERAAAFKWQKEERESQELEIKYMEPWLLGYPFNIQLGLFQRVQDSTYVQRRLDGSVEFLATDEISASLIISSESTIPTDPNERGFTVYNSTSLTTGASIKVDTRDDVYAPTEGLLFLNTYKYSSKNINGPEQFITTSTKTKVDLQRFELDLNYYYELFSRQVIAAGLHGRELRGNLFEISDLYKLGGTNTLRGYIENQFLGNRIFWSNLEYRYLISKRSYMFGFYDAGYYLRSADKDRGITKLKSFKTGYGLGLSIETGLGVMAISFALGEGDSFSEGKIHFGLLNEF